MLPLKKLAIRSSIGNIRSSSGNFLMKRCLVSRDTRNTVYKTASNVAVVQYSDFKVGPVSAFISHGQTIRMYSVKSSIVSTYQDLWKNLKERKARLMLEYGTTFIFLHEFFGITSYGVVFALLSFNIVNVDYILQNVTFLQDLNLSRALTNWAITVALVKVMDVHGLVLLRWCLTIGLTPHVAKYIGPTLDRMVLSFKERKEKWFPKKVEVLDNEQADPIPLKPNAHVVEEVQVDEPKKKI